jgi:hypothetical protein
MPEQIPSGIVWRILFSISAPRVAVMSDAMNPGATAFAYEKSNGIIRKTNP